MILSSADIERILGGDPIIRQEAKLSIVDGKPGLGIDEYVYIYIDRYPVVEDFEATWKIWVINSGSDFLDVVLNVMTSRLPKFDFNGKHYTTTDFASDKTVVRSQADIELEATRAERERLQKDFSGLQEGLQARLSTVRDGRDGIDGRDGLDGKDGRDGRDGKDGRDMVATETDLEDLRNVEQNIAKEDGQVLTWKDGVWQNLFIPQVVSSIGGGGGGGGALNADDVREIVGLDVTGEPLGHVNRADSVMSFDPGTMTFTIEPAVAGVPFEVWTAGGVRRFYDTAQTVVIPSENGGRYIVFDENGDLVWIPGFPDWPNHALISYIYWNEDSQQLIYMGDERHGVTLDWQTHEYLHRTRGASLANGFGAYGFVDDGDGSLDSHAQLSIGNGTFFDEDVQVDIQHATSPAANSFQQILQGPAEIPVLYRSGTSWIRDAATLFPCKTGPSRLYYNTEAGGSWSLTEAASNRYVNMWLVATSNLLVPVVAIMGQSSHSNISGAASVKFGDLDLSGFITPEWRQLHQVVFQTSENYANQVNAKIVAVIDIRVTDDLEAGATPGVSYIDDLLDVDTSTVAPTIGQTLEWDGANWVPADRVQSVNGHIGIVVLDADDIGTTGTVNKFTTTEEINKLAGIEVGAQVNEVEEAPLDGNYYVRASATWVKLTDALAALGVMFVEPVDAGNFTTGLGTAITNRLYDGGDFTSGASSATDSNTLDGGLTTP